MFRISSHRYIGSVPTAERKMVRLLEALEQLQPAKDRMLEEKSRLTLRKPHADELKQRYAQAQMDARQLAQSREYLFVRRFLAQRSILLQHDLLVSLMALQSEGTALDARGCVRLQAALTSVPFVGALRAAGSLEGSEDVTRFWITHFMLQGGEQPAATVHLLDASASADTCALPPLHGEACVLLAFNPEAAPAQPRLNALLCLPTGGEVEVYTFTFQANGALMMWTTRLSDRLRASGQVSAVHRLPLLDGCLPPAALRGSAAVGLALALGEHMNLLEGQPNVQGKIKSQLEQTEGDVTAKYAALQAQALAQDDTVSW